MKSCLIVVHDVCTVSYKEKTEQIHVILVT